MNSKHFSWLSIASLVVGFIACLISSVFNLGGGLIWIIAGITSFVSLQFCSAILDNLERMPSRIKAELDGTKPLIPDSEEVSTNFYQLAKGAYIPTLNTPARKRAVEAVKNSGFISTDKVKTKEGYSVGFDANSNQVAIVCPDGEYYIFSAAQLKNFGIKIDKTNDGAVNYMGVLICTDKDEIHIVTYDGPVSHHKNEEEARDEADQIIRLLNKVRK